MRLRPVIEMAPYSYARPDRPMPDGPSSAHPEAWRRYWEQAREDAGLGRLEPLVDHLVAVEDLVEPAALRALLRAPSQEGVEESISTRSLEPVSSLEGGHVVERAGERIVPRCCASLKDLDGWQRAAEGDVIGFWMGHPQLIAEVEGTELRLRDEEAPTRRWTLPLDELGTAITEARELQRALAERLVPLLEERGADPRFAVELAQTLAGLRG